MKTRNDLGRYLNHLDLKGTGVEVGVHRGDFSRIILDTWLGNSLYLVDCWTEQPRKTYDDVVNTPNLVSDYYFVKQRFADEPRVNVMRAYSLDASRNFLDDSLDFVYIDANHSFLGVMTDLCVWWPKIRSGGMICGHDYVNGEFVVGKFRVKEAVDTFIHGMTGAICHHTEEQWPSWWYFK